MEMETCLPRMTQSGQDLCTQHRILGAEAAFTTQHIQLRGAKLRQNCNQP